MGTDKLSFEGVIAGACATGPETEVCSAYAQPGAAQYPP